MNIEIDNEKLREEIIEKVTDMMVDLIIYGDPDLSWDDRKKDGKKRREAILAKINWSKSTDELNNAIVRKFFDKAFK